MKETDMSIIFSKKCEYGIQAMLLLSTFEPGDVASAEEIADVLQIPKDFISKILQELTWENLVSSKRGKKGGFFIAKNPFEIRILDIVLAIDGSDIFNKCVLGFPDCSSDKPCPVHKHWSVLITKTKELIKNKTVGEIREETRKKILTIKK